MRGTIGYVDNIDNLKTWVDLHKRPEFVLASNFCEAIPSNSKGVIYRQENRDMPLDESWELLYNLISMQSTGARLTVFIPTNDAGNRMYSTRIQIGGAPAWGAAPQYPGVAGMPLGIGSIQEAIAKEREKWELERRLEDLEAQLSGPQSTGVWGLIERKLAEADATELVNTVSSLGIAILEKFFPTKGTMPGVALAGAPYLDDEPDTDTMQPPPQYQFQTDRVIPVLIAIRQHFGDDDEEFYKFIESLAKKFGDNPAMYKMMLK